MSEWEDMCGWLGISNDEFAADKVVGFDIEEGVGFFTRSDIVKELVRVDLPLNAKIVKYEHFDSFAQAAEWAKANPGCPFSRAADGHGFEYLPSANKLNSTNPLLLRSQEIRCLAPRLSRVIEESGVGGNKAIMKPLNCSRWGNELDRLTLGQLKHLRHLLEIEVECSLSFIDAYKAESVGDPYALNIDGVIRLEKNVRSILKDTIEELCDRISKGGQGVND